MSDETTKKQLLSAYLNVTVALVRSDNPDLTDRQKSVLLKVYNDDTPQTVRGLAKFTEVSKPAITRALDRLSEFDLVRRRTDPADRRSVLVQRTVAGRNFVRFIMEVLADSQ